MYLTLHRPRRAPCHCLLVRLLRENSEADVAGCWSNLLELHKSTAAIRQLAAVVFVFLALQESADRRRGLILLVPKSCIV